MAVVNTGDDLVARLLCITGIGLADELARHEGAALAELDAIGAELDGYHLLHATRGTLLQRLGEFLLKCGPKAQSTIRLKYRLGHSNAEIGKIVGGSKQYIGRLLSKSLALLHDCLKGKALNHG